MEKNIHLFQNRTRAEYVQIWGNATSIALLDPHCNLFSIPTIDGAIAYRIASKYAVVFGDPLCATNNIDVLTNAFHFFCQNNKKSIIYIAASENFMEFTLDRYCHTVLEIGNEIILDPAVDPTQHMGKQASALRNKYNQSLRNDLLIKEYRGFNEDIEEAMQEVRDLWLQHRKGPQISLLNINMFADRAHKRWFYAKHREKIVGVLMLSRLDAYQGWVLNILMVAPEAPKVTSECIVLSALAQLRSEACRFFSVGTVPAAHLGRVEGLGPFAQLIARSLFKTAKKIFQLNDRQRYWQKFHPQTKPSFVLFSKSRVRVSEVLGIVRALNAKI